ESLTAHNEQPVVAQPLHCDGLRVLRAEAFRRCRKVRDIPHGDVGGLAHIRDGQCDKLAAVRADAHAGDYGIVHPSIHRGRFGGGPEHGEAEPQEECGAAELACDAVRVRHRRPAGPGTGADIRARPGFALHQKSNLFESCSTYVRPRRSYPVPGTVLKTRAAVAEPQPSDTIGGSLSSRFRTVPMTSQSLPR